MDSTLKTFVIPNDLCRRAGLAVSWNFINYIGVYPSQHVTHKSNDTPSAFAPSPTSVFNLRQEVILFRTILRKLVNESNGIFLSLQSLATKNIENIHVELLQVSRQYRSVIRACLEDLQNEAMNATDNYNEELQNYITIFYSVECVWHLCEILFVSNIPGNVVLPHLLEWIRFHFPKCERQASKLINETVGVESHPDYWETVIGCLMQGRIATVRGLLKLHTASDSKLFKLADETLQALPVYNVYSGISVAEYNLRWKHWVLETKSKIDAKLFLAEKHINLIMKLVIGDETAWNQIKINCDTWYELLAAWLFFTEPTVKSFELGLFARRCIIKMGVQNRLKHLDQMLLAAMESDLLQVMKEIQHMAENGWFATHLTDVLYWAGQLDSLDVGPSMTVANKSASRQLRESFILDYGTLLMGHSSLWQVGLSYLDCCSINGTKAMELLIVRLPLTSEAKTLKLIREAQRRNLTPVVTSICKLQGLTSLRRGRPGNALAWAIKSQDGCLTAFIAEKFLKDYVNSGTLQCIDFLDSMGSSMLSTDMLVFLGKYREFQKEYHLKRHREAAAIIIELLTSKVTPKYFWITLFNDALPLLEHNDVVFSSNDTYTVLYYLEEKSYLPELKGIEMFLRLAIARNLSRALTYEAQNTN